MAAVNITIELLGSAIVLVLIVSLITNGDAGSKDGRLFGWVLGLLLVILLCDAVGWAVKDKPGTWRWYTLVASNFVVYTAGVGMAILHTAYLLAYIEQKQPVSRKWIVRIAIYAAMLEVFVIVSLFTGAIYWIDASNGYMTGPLYRVFMVAFFMPYCYFAYMLVVYRKAMNRSELVNFAAYALLAMIANCMEIYFEELMLTYAATTVAALLVYVNIQSRKNKQLELDMAESRITVMLSQIKPHFLYNTLVAIERLCVKDPEQARAAVASFSTYLRGNLDALSEHSTIPFQKELEHVKTYLSLEQKRFGDRLRVVYSIQAEQFMLPALTLQPIVENAVQHGVMRRMEGGTIHILAQEQADCWCITVEDDGVGMQADYALSPDHAHIGMQNVQNRLSAMCGGWLKVQSVPQMGTKVALYIPKEG